MADTTHHIELGEITVDVVLKDIKNIHLSVYPPMAVCGYLLR